MSFLTGQATLTIHSAFIDENAWNAELRTENQAAIHAVMTQDVIPAQKVYPAELPDQRYVRTYHLLDVLDTPDLILYENDGANGVAASLNPDVAGDYIYVIDQGNQAWMHQGRWTTLQDEIDHNQDVLAVYLLEGAEAALARLMR